MNTHLNRHIAVAGAYNIRDLGGYRTPTGETAWRRLLRADGLHRIDAEGMALLVETGVVTVVDLRHDNECAEQPNPLARHESVRYHNVSLFADLAPTGPSSGDVLLDLYIKALDERGAVIAQVLTLIAEADEGAVLFHCTAGKDRTGIIAALLLALAGVETTLILEDYALTAKMIEPMVEELMAGARERGIDTESFRPMLAAEPLTMERTIAHIETAHGSVEDYLDGIGLDRATVAKLRNRLSGEE
ncbi:tyrosine-protein phosphatase [Pelagibacterium mangrovi]|uniref:tyrosine-protein phosphatase n=1 Tax=Pelagibacterium mangrovi TaxID=3119828 RepID=UPI002FC8ACFF